MRVLITAGPTREYLDDVRFITNGSSGRMGYLIAETASQRGWEVVLVSGPVNLVPPESVHVVKVVTANEMLNACQREWDECDGLIAVAAVSDYRPIERIAGKHHRGSGEWQVDFVQNPDILAELCRSRDKQWAVGFAVEADDLLERAKAKRDRKQCDAIIANPTASIESQETTIHIIDSNSDVVLSYCGTKLQASEQIVSWVAGNLSDTD